MKLKLCENNCGTDISGFSASRKFCDACRILIRVEYQREYIRKTPQIHAHYSQTTLSECRYIDRLPPKILAKYIKAQALRDDWADINPVKCMKHAKDRLATL